MGGNIIPAFVQRGTANVYDFAATRCPGATDRDRGYWRDVGTLDAYHDAHMDLVSVHPIFNLYNPSGRSSRCPRHLPPAKFVEGGVARESMVGSGTIVSGADVLRSVVGGNVRIVRRQPGRGLGDHARGPDRRRSAVVRNAILDKNVVVADGAQIGVDLAEDRVPIHRDPRRASP